MPVISAGDRSLWLRGGMLLDDIPDGLVLDSLQKREEAAAQV